MNQRTVALFKAESDEKQSDPYIKVLEIAGFKATVVPTLQFNFINENALQKCLESAQDFSGIIFTSPRTVKAVHQVCDSKGIDISKWKEKMNYSVGAATSSLAESLLNLHLVGAESGNSEKLCKFILSSNPAPCSLPYLYPCGNKRKDTVSRVLFESGIKLVEIESYETVCNPHLKECWELLIEKQGIPDVLVYFSPSGVEFSYNIVKEYCKEKEPKYVAIGPSTAEALAETNIQSYTVAVKPNAESVLTAINSLFKD